MEDREARERAARVEGLLAELDGLPEPGRSKALAAAQALVELYGEGLARVVATAGTELSEALVEDELIAHLLLVHDLHPVPLEERVARALEEVRPYLGSHGGGVELLGVEAGVARLRLEGSCDGCPSSAMTLKLAVEEAIQRAAPEVERVEAKGVEQPAGPALLQLEVSDSLRRDAATAEGGWETVADLPPLAAGGRFLGEVVGEPLLFLRVERDLYAYRPTCPGCGESLQDGGLRGAELRCASCGNTYDVRRAGRCLDSPQLHLEPVPLLEEARGAVRVAVGAAA